MMTTVLTPCAGCGDLIEVELAEDGSDEMAILMESHCDPCLDFMFYDPDDPR